MKQSEIKYIIENCEFEKIKFLVENKEEAFAIIHTLAQKEDMRAYIFLVLMISYCKINKKDIVAELSNLAAFVSITFFNYIEGMILLSYNHQKEAIQYDSENIEYKRVFLDMYYTHPDVKHDVEFEVEIAKSMSKENELAQKVIKDNL